MLLGGISSICISSCAVSEKKAGERFALGGAAVGGFTGYLLGKQHGRTKGDAVKGALIGAVGGGAAGEGIGKKSSTLDGIVDVIEAR